MSKQADYLNQYLKTLSSFQAQEIEILDALLQSWQPQLAAKIWHSMGYPIIGYGESCYQINVVKTTNGLSSVLRLINLILVFISGASSGKNTS